MFEAVKFIIKYGGMVLRFGPVFVSVVRAVEQLRGGLVSGPQKKEIAVRSLESLLAVFGYTPTPQVKKLVDHGIELVVSALTIRGELVQKGAKAVVLELKAEDIPKQALSVSETLVNNERNLESLRRMMAR